jgi:large subunit ribosomal protein L6
MKVAITKEIEMTDGVTAQLANGVLTVKGPNGEASRALDHPKIKVTIENDKITLGVEKGGKREKTMVHTFAAHVGNLVSGVTEPHMYKLKICSGHFPISVEVSATEVVIKNFLGETVPRRVGIIHGSTVKLEGTEIIVTSPNKELAGQTAARIESACRISNRDKRIFQDGCYIINKSGRAM